MSQNQFPETPRSLAIEKSALKELLLKCWMTHDGMWFHHCVKEFGIEKANRINKAAIRSLAAIEIERVRKAFQLKGIESFQDVKILCEAAFGVLSDDFMGFTYHFPRENVLSWQMGKCFAHAGMTRLGLLESYECGVVYRVASWFDSLGIEYTLAPPVERCLMHVTVGCRGEFQFSL